MSRRLVTRSFTAATVLVAAAVLTGCLPTSAPPLGRPAVRQAASAPVVWDASDPGVLVTGGRTYLFGSNNNMLLPVRELTSFTGQPKLI